jgi:hypothetical protein
MRSKNPGIGLILVGLLTLVVNPSAGQERFRLELEGLVAWQSRNDVEIPNDGSATRFSLVDLVGNGPVPAPRLSFAWNIAPRHAVHALLAPFSYTETGSFTNPVFFVDRTFAANVPTEATYKFNSWRLGYRYRFHSSTRWDAWVGFTAKIRDAKIELQQGSVGAKDTNVGFVPLLHLSSDVRFAETWHVLFDVEGLAGGPGRAVDFALELGRDIGAHWIVSAGYRTLEGGADVTDVYNFAWFNDVVVSVVYRWGGDR